MMPRRSCAAAFTIVELLIAVTITVLIVVMLGTMFGSLTNTTSRANQRIDSFRDARAALQMMERDLSGLVRNQRDASGAALTRPAAYLVLKNLYADPASVNPSTDNQQIYALIATKNSQTGDMCSVGYYCRWDPSKYSYSLHRFFNPSANTYSRFDTQPVRNANYASETDLYDFTLPGASDDVLASHIWSLRITPYDASGVVLAAPYPYVCDSSAASNDPLPAAIEISFKAMSPEAARTIMSVSTDPLDWIDPTRSRNKLLIAPNAYEFRTRIRF